MTWGDAHLQPGDRVCAPNGNLWWLVIGSAKRETVLLYVSPEHRRVGIFGRTGIVESSANLDGTFWIERKALRNE